MKKARKLLLLFLLVSVYFLNQLVFCDSWLGYQTAQNTAKNYFEEKYQIMVDVDDISVSLGMCEILGGAIQYRTKFFATCLLDKSTDEFIQVSIPGYLPFWVISEEKAP